MADRRITCAAAAALAACASQTALKRAEELPAGEVAVFGQVRVLEDGQRTSRTVTLFVAPEGRSQGERIDLEDDGSFTWHLRPGAYQIAGFRIGAAFLHAELGSGRIGGRLVVPEGAGAVYAGTLQLSFAGGRYGRRVQDEYDEARAGFARRFPSLAPRAVKQLMTMEEEP